MAAQSKHCTCCTCGFTWERFTNGSHSCSSVLKARLDAMQPREGFAVQITRQDGTTFFSSSGFGEGRAVWSKRNRKYAVEARRAIREAGMNAKVVPVLFFEPQICTPHR